MHIPRPTYANLTATLALVVALSAGAYAAGLAKNSVGTKQLQKGAVTSAKVKNGSLKAADLKTGTIPEVPLFRGVGSGAAEGSVAFSDPGVGVSVRSGQFASPRLVNTNATGDLYVRGLMVNGGSSASVPDSALGSVNLTLSPGESIDLKQATINPDYTHVIVTRSGSNPVSITITCQSVDQPGNFYVACVGNR
jgi:hypothetical protein